MHRATKVLVMSLVLAVILLVSIAGTAFAGGSGPNSDCTNPDCPCGDQNNNGPGYQNGEGPAEPKGNAFQHQNRFGKRSED
ncbi:hypothetical protein ACFLVX_02650 [Chloroflexota bacterium]